MKSRVLLSFLKVLSWLPLSTVRAIGAGLGRVCWWSRRRMARTTLRNLELCFPELEQSARNDLALRSLIETFRTICEAGAIWLWPAVRTLGLIREAEGLPLLQEAYRRGRGIILLAPHLGNWELLGLYLNTCGCGQTSQLYQAPADAGLAQLIYHARSRAGARMVATDKKGVADLLQALRRGELVGILPDQVPPDSGGDFADFFKVPALTMTLACRLAQKTGAAIVLAYARRSNDGLASGFKIVIRAPNPKIYAEHMPTALQAMNDSIEALVREAPEQYQWEYKRFKRQPAGKDRPY